MAQGRKERNILLNVGGKPFRARTGKNKMRSSAGPGESSEGDLQIYVPQASRSDECAMKKRKTAGSSGGMTGGFRTRCKKRTLMKGLGSLAREEEKRRFTDDLQERNSTSRESRTSNRMWWGGEGMKHKTSTRRK